MLSFSRVVALPQLRSYAMANSGGTSALLSSKQISNIQDVSKKGDSCSDVHNSIRNWSWGILENSVDINDGGKSTKQNTLLGCYIMYGRHYSGLWLIFYLVADYL